MSRLILGNSTEELFKLPDESVELIITSPPYKDRDGFNKNDLSFIFEQLYRIQSPNTLFFLNFGHLAEDKFRPFSVCNLALSAGYKLNDTITWVKNHYKPIQGNKRLNNLTEFIFLLYKGKMPKLNRLEIGVPYKDKSNAKRFSSGQDLKCGGNVWYINYDTINNKSQKLHNDRFPLDLPTRCIKLCGYKVDTVLDPFAGSGTTGIAAEKLNKEYILIERNPIYKKIFESRLNES